VARNYERVAVVLERLATDPLVVHVVHGGEMLRVLCADSELAEEGDVLAVGDRPERLAGRPVPGFYGTELDDIEWVFDRYAQVGGGRRIAVISGLVVSIDAVYVSLTLTPQGWAPAAGTATLEALYSTASTRRPEHRIVWGAASAPDQHGDTYRAGYPAFEEGDENFTGWVITLAEEHVHPADAVL